MQFSGENSKYRVRKSNIIPVILFAYLCVYAAVNTLIAYIVPVSVMRFGFVTAGTACYTLIFFTSKINKNEFLIFTALFIMALFPLVSHDKSGWEISQFLVWISTLEIVYLLMKEKIPVEVFFKILIVIYTVHAICTIIFYFTPDLYLNYIVNLFPEQRDRLIRFYQQGCMAGLANNYSTNGNFLVTGLIITFSKIISGRKSDINKFIFLLFIVALLMTGKRGQLIFGLLVLFVLYYIKMTSQHENIINVWLKIIGIILICLVIGIIVVSGIPALSVSVRRIQESLETGDLDNGRYRIWKLAIEQFRLHPVWGIGWKVFKDRVSYRLNSSRLYDVHNVYLQLLCETGIIGFILFLTWFIAMLVMAFKNLKKIYVCERNRGIIISVKDRFYACFALGYQVFFLLYCFTGNPLYDLICFIPYFVSCGITLYCRNILELHEKCKQDSSVKR